MSIAKNRKGFDFVVNGLIITIVVGLIFFYVGAMAGEVINEAQARENCRTSAVFKAKTQTWVTDSPVSLNCHTQFIDVRDDGIFVNGKESISAKPTDDSVKRAVANQLYDCWYQFGAGTINPFWQEIAAWTDKTHCVICSQISFEPKAIAELKATNPDGKLTGFEDWLKQNNIQENAAATSDSNTKYYDYLTKTSPAVAIVNHGISFSEDTIDTSQTYDVVYVAYDPAKINAKNALIAALPIGGVISTVASELWDYFHNEKKPGAPIMQTLVINEKNIGSAGCSQLY
jgi:hypothetical protein